ncbi:MAG: hypothetical protein HW390_529 [Candidatus Brocadiaceae bacterium]|nr:hypothetical protein [Candidatus Brocadiaceae bacterium]
MLESFRLAKFRFTVCAREQIRLPDYKGAVFRGGFGYAFKKVVCVVKGKPCDACLLKQKCIYSYIFETPPPDDTEILRLYPKVPHPFVIEPPVTEKQVFAPGEPFSFHLILIGNAIDYLPYFIYTFTELGKQGIGSHRGKYSLEQVEGVGLDGKSVEIYTHKTQTLANRYPIIQAHQLDHQRLAPAASHAEEKHVVVSAQSNGEAGLNAPAAASSHEGINSSTTGENHHNTITISLRTPLRIRFDGQIASRLEFHVLFRNLLRRVSSLSYFHCGKKLDVDFKGIIQKAVTVKQTQSDLHWYDWKRYSTRQEEWMSLGGIVGNVSYEGDLSDFMTLLRLGEYVHVGKGTSFGLGKYEML